MPARDRTVFDLLVRRRAVAELDVELDLRVTRALVDDAAAACQLERLRSALLDEAVACLSLAQRFTCRTDLVVDEVDSASSC